MPAHPVLPEAAAAPAMPSAAPSRSAQAPVDARPRPTTKAREKTARSTPESPSGTTLGSEAAQRLLEALESGMKVEAVYVDEIAPNKDRPSPHDREVFLSGLPFHDYSEEELKEWVKQFGPVDSIVFVRDLQTKKPRGSGEMERSQNQQ